MQLDGGYLSTGVRGLDNAMSGYPKGKTILVEGEAGTGKTILALHFIERQCSAGNHCHLVLTEELKNDIIAQGDSFGFRLGDHIASGLLHITELLPDRAAGKKVPGLHRFFETLDLPDGSILVLDNLGAFDYSGMDSSTIRNVMDRVIYNLTSKDVTALFVCSSIDSSEMAKTITFSVYGVIRLMRRNNPFTDVRERIIDIVKMRNTTIPTSYLYYDIDPGNGFSVKE